MTFKLFFFGFLSASSGRMKANLVNKLVEVKEFSIYWNSNEDDGKNLLMGNTSPPISTLPQDKWTYLIHPFDASLRFMVGLDMHMVLCKYL